MFLVTCSWVGFLGPLKLTSSCKNYHAAEQRNISNCMKGKTKLQCRHSFAEADHDITENEIDPNNDKNFITNSIWSPLTSNVM